MTSNKKLRARGRRDIPGSGPNYDKAHGLKPKRPEANNGKYPLVPAPLMDLICKFSYDHGYGRAAHCLKTETQKRESTGGFTKPCSWTDAGRKYPSIVKIFEEWQGLHPEIKWLPEEEFKAKVAAEGGKDKSKDDVDDEEAEDSGDESSSSSDSDDAGDSDSDTGSTKAGAVVEGKAPEDVKIPSSNESAGDVSSSVSTDSESENETAAKAVDKAAEVPTTTFKRKSPISDSGSDSSDASSSDSSDSESENVKPAKAVKKPLEQPVKSLKRKAPASDSGSNSGSVSSSDPSSDSDSEAEPAPIKAATEIKSLKRKAPPSASSSDSESSSDSSASGSEPATKKTKLTNPIITKAVAKASSSDTSASDSSSDPSSDSDTSATSDVPIKKETKTTKPPKTSKPSLPTPVLSNPNSNSSDSSETIAPTSPDLSSAPATAITNGSKQRERAVPFSRIAADQKVDPRFSSNAYVPNDYSERAYADLVVTKGKNFTKEKNKKKRGAYKGGYLDTDAVKSVKFDD
ncbi:hypothetical protein EJ08DRAFT_648636 [Tothia fuscella]|uniref:Srp40 C-terminal domain-containing protein n=1 Tax=Tothia fuscella TaxID=1048955 RepID=A0A9P4NTX5_9PEZI|nr:hypothetical protein EJ08DRAFT_648636 [Tothia fuscella]